MFASPPAFQSVGNTCSSVEPWPFETSVMNIGYTGLSTLYSRVHEPPYSFIQVTRIYFPCHVYEIWGYI
jgi:hypothetical protein